MKKRRAKLEHINTERNEEMLALAAGAVRTVKATPQTTSPSVFLSGFGHCGADNILETRVQGDPPNFPCSLPLTASVFVLCRMPPNFLVISYISYNCQDTPLYLETFVFFIFDNKIY